MSNFYRVETAHHHLSSYNQFVQTPLDNLDGRLHLSAAPGLGIEMNMDYLQANAIDGFGRQKRGF